MARIPVAERSVAPSAGELGPGMNLDPHAKERAAFGKELEEAAGSFAKEIDKAVDHAERLRLDINQTKLAGRAEQIRQEQQLKQGLNAEGVTDIGMEELQNSEEMGAYLSSIENTRNPEYSGRAVSALFKTSERLETKLGGHEGEQREQVRIETSLSNIKLAQKGLAAAVTSDDMFREGADVFGAVYRHETEVNGASDKTARQKATIALGEGFKSTILNVAKHDPEKAWDMSKTLEKKAKHFNIGSQSENGTVQFKMDEAAEIGLSGVNRLELRNAALNEGLIRRANSMPGDIGSKIKEIRRIGQKQRVPESVIRKATDAIKDKDRDEKYARDESIRIGKADATQKYLDAIAKGDGSASILANLPTHVTAQMSPSELGELRANEERLSRPSPIFDSAFERLKLRYQDDPRGLVSRLATRVGAGQVLDEVGINNYQKAIRWANETAEKTKEKVGFGIFSEGREASYLRSMALSSFEGKAYDEEDLEERIAAIRVQLAEQKTKYLEKYGGTKIPRRQIQNMVINILREFKKPRPSAFRRLLQEGTSGIIRKLGFPETAKRIAPPPETPDPSEVRLEGDLSLPPAPRTDDVIKPEPQQKTVSWDEPAMRRQIGRTLKDAGLAPPLAYDTALKNDLARALQSGDKARINAVLKRFPRR